MDLLGIQRLLPFLGVLAQRAGVFSCWSCLSQLRCKADSLGNRWGCARCLIPCLRAVQVSHTRDRAASEVRGGHAWYQWQGHKRGKLGAKARKLDSLCVESVMMRRVRCVARQPHQQRWQAARWCPGPMPADYPSRSSHLASRSSLLPQGLIIIIIVLLSASLTGPCTSTLHAAAGLDCPCQTEGVILSNSRQLCLCCRARLPCLVRRRLRPKSGSEKVQAQLSLHT
jgi:hypothetical protein